MFFFLQSAVKINFILFVVTSNSDPVLTPYEQETKDYEKSTGKGSCLGIRRDYFALQMTS